MKIVVLGLMKNPGHAREVARALADAGFEREDIAGDDGFIAGLCNSGVPLHEAHAYAETYALVFGEYPAGTGRIYRNRRLTRRAA